MSGLRLLRSNEEDRVLVQRGYRAAKAITRHHAKSFFFASAVLFGQRRKAAFALYAFCRSVDDLVDASQSSHSMLEVALERVRSFIDEIYTQPAASVFEDLMPYEVISAFRDTVYRFQIPAQPFHDLVLGMQMDLTQNRYQTWNELDLYCYRVAGTVGLMMAPVLGCSDPRAHVAASDLGKAMQLTNILRDIREDFERGRIYLPQDELEAFGVSESTISEHRVDEAFKNLMRAQIDRARQLYRRGAAGISALSGFGSQSMVRVMSSVYGAILSSIEHNDFDVFRSRAAVPFGRKLQLAAKAIAFKPVYHTSPRAISSGVQ